ncbi:MAG: zf-HC2 domain-containing protein [Actinobacteria bacterium]|nr:MAG: zf-HC2 domain-containing protein [Actinomycetota bacterium]
MTCVRTVDIGPYLLGAVSAGQRLQLEEHLESCPMCREEVVRLAGLPGLLWRAASDDVHEPRLDTPGVPEDVPSSRPRRHRRRVAAMVAALAIVGGTVAGLDLTVGRTSPPAIRPSAQPASTTLAASDPATKVSATAVLTAQPWGTGVRLSMRGLPYGARCELVVHAANGSSDISGTWNAAYTPRVDIPAATDIDRANIASLEITTANQHLITIPAQSTQE